MKNKMLVVFSSNQGQKFLKLAGIAMAVVALALPSTAFAGDMPNLPF